MPGWQKIYQELKPKGFEIIAIAQDSGGAKVAKPWYDRAKATFTALVDTRHVVTELYQMVNVPTGVWVDEQGRIVRPPEVAYTKASRVMGQQVGHKNYVPGLRDWVEKGAKSVFAMSQSELDKRLAALSPERAEADAAFKLAVYLFKQGKKEEADALWKRAQELDPDNWNYHRQAWSFEPGAGQKWFRKVMQRQGKPYYAPLDLPEPGAAKPEEPAPKKEEPEDKKKKKRIF